MLNWPAKTNTSGGGPSWARSYATTGSTALEDKARLDDNNAVDARDLAQWLLRGAVISWGGAVAFSILFSPTNPLTHWVPPACRGGWAGWSSSSA